MMSTTPLSDEPSEPHIDRGGLHTSVLRTSGTYAVWLGLITASDALMAGWNPMSRPWQGVWGTAGLIAASAYWLAKQNCPTRWVVRYGVIAAVAFGPRLWILGEHGFLPAGGGPISRFIYLLAACSIAVVTAMLAALAAGLQHAVAQCLALNTERRARSRTSVAAELANLPHDSGVGRSRLGLRHLLLWVAATALCLGVLRIGVYWPESPFWVKAIGVIRAPSEGAAIVGLLIFFTGRFRGLAFPSQPGEFLWLAEGIAIALLLFGDVVIAAAHVMKLDDPVIYFALIGTGEFALGLVSIAAIGCMPTSRWRFFFGMTAAVAFGQSLLAGLRYADMVAYSETSNDIILLISTIQVVGQLLFCLAVDRRYGIHYTWTHWVGIAIRVFGAAMTILIMLWDRLFN